MLLYCIKPVQNVVLSLICSLSKQTAFISWISSDNVENNNDYSWQSCHNIPVHNDP